MEVTARPSTISSSTGWSSTYSKEELNCPPRASQASEPIRLASTITTTTGWNSGLNTPAMRWTGPFADHGVT